MFKKIVLSCSLISLLGLASCYQAHSDDDLRTIPATNNPNIIPQSSSSRMPSVM